MDDFDSNSDLFDVVLVCILSISLSLLLLTWIYDICAWIYLLYLRTLVFFTSRNAESNILNNPLVLDDSHLWVLKRQREEAIKKLPPPEEYSHGYDNNTTTTASNNNCAICLEEFVSGELCRVLPICKHVYHFQCINNWLHDELSCPICRCSVMV